MLQKMKQRDGFTIVELLIVIVIIGVLAAIVFVSYNGIQARAKEAAAEGAASQGATKIQSYAVVNADTYPADLAGTGLSNSGTTQYEYSVDNPLNPKTFCLTATFQGVSYYVSNTNGLPTNGLCSGHTGGGSVALTCPTNFIVVPGISTYGTSDFCVMKYEARNVSGTPTSQSSGTPWVSISQTTALSIATTACAGCHLITEAEWLTIAQNVLSVPSNWSGGSVGTDYIYSGHGDAGPDNSLASSTDNDGYSGTGQSSGNQRRTLTLTNGAVIWDFAGNVWEWTNGTASGGQPGSAGYSWRDWNSLSVPGSFSPNPYPSFANSSASTWNSPTHGIGMVYSNSNENLQRSYRRGGAWAGGAVNGPFSLLLDVGSSHSDIYIGFRAAK